MPDAIAEAADHQVRRGLQRGPDCVADILRWRRQDMPSPAGLDGRGGWLAAALAAAAPMPGLRDADRLQDFPVCWPQRGWLLVAALGFAVEVAIHDKTYVLHPWR
jgi:hypothetical protein